MATKKSASKKTSSGSGPKSKRIVKSKVGKTMHEFKHQGLKSGRSGKTVKNPKQAIAIGLSEARRSGANIPKKGASKKSAAKKSTAKKATKKTTTKKSPAKKGTTKKTTSKKTATQKR